MSEMIQLVAPYDNGGYLDPSMTQKWTLVDLGRDRAGHPQMFLGPLGTAVRDGDGRLGEICDGGRIHWIGNTIPSSGRQTRLPLRVVEWGPK